jgi:5-(carboxyamino)imidazole ribonucleotide mutase
VRDNTPLVGVVMGSNSDWEVMQHAVSLLKEFDIPLEARVVSAHRMPDEMFRYAEEAGPRGLKAIIAGAGGAAHLPGMLAAKTTVPVLGVPVPSRHLNGEDSLLSIVQMPRGIPVATFAIGESGAVNAALFVVAMLALADANLSDALNQFRALQTQAASGMKLPV